MIFFRKARKPSKQRAEELKRELEDDARAKTEGLEENTPEASDSAASAAVDADRSSVVEDASSDVPSTESTLAVESPSAKQTTPKSSKPPVEQPADVYTPQEFAVALERLTSAEATELARRIAIQTAGSESGVAEHLESLAIEDGIVAHYFAANLDGYKGWKWAVVLTLMPGEARVSVSESVLLPSDGALLAPAWVPFKDRLKPADMTEVDEIEYAPDDERLETLALLKKEDLKVLENLALERNRVLNAYGKEDLAVRWYEGTHGPFTASTRIAGARCMSCAFYIPLAGDLGQLFGACGNAWSRDDGRVVSADHGCGMHSETDVKKKSKRWNPVDSAIDQFDNVDLDTPEETPQPEETLSEQDETLAD